MTAICSNDDFWVGAGSSGELDVLIITPSLSEAQRGEVGLEAYGDFTSVDILTQTSGLTAAQLDGYEAILTWSDSPYQDPTGTGNLLAQYTQNGGGVVLATYGLSYPWGIDGDLADIAPLTPTSSRTSLTGNVVATVPGDDIFSGIDFSSLNGSFFNNSNFADAQLTVGSELLATDGAGTNMIARNADGNIISANLFPGFEPVSDVEFWELFANMVTDVATEVPPLTDEDTAHTISALDILANDTDPDGDTLSVSAVSAVSALGATVILNGDGSVTYDPTSSTTLDEMAEGETLQDSFTYTVSDGNGGFDTAAVTLTVSGIDDPPILNGTAPALAGFSNEDFSYQLASDLFLDHDEGGAISYDVTVPDGSALPSFMSYDANTGTISFAAGAPLPSDVGVHALLVTATEPDGQSSTTTITLTVLDGTLVEGTSGNDNLTGTIQGDLILGYGGHDTIIGQPGADVLDGGEGNDNLQGEAGNDVLIGGLGNDNLAGHSGDDLLQGGDGNDYLNAGDGNDTADGGAGNDTINGGEWGTSNLLIGGDGDDVFHNIGPQGMDTVDAGAGDDLIGLYLYQSDLTVTTGSGSDLITLGYSYVYGSNNATITDFDVSQDSMEFDSFLSNRLTGWDGASNPFGAGFLRLVQNGSDTILEVDVNGGGDSYVGFITFENTNVGDFTDVNFLIDVPTLEGYRPDGGGIFGATIVGSATAEALNGGIGDDSLVGLAGSDTLTGGNGNDTILGGADDDQIIGSFGNDDLSGGLGADSFVFALGEGNDVIQDFDVGTDVLSLTGGQTIFGIAEVDTDMVGGVDSTLVEFADGATVLLNTVLGVTDFNDLL